MTSRKQVFAVVGPSGAGKDSLIQGALAACPGLHLVRRVITRPSEAGGENYEGISEQSFMNRMSAGEFALTWEAHGLRYGIPKREIDVPMDVIFNGSRAALSEAVTLVPGLRVILVTAPDAILARRLADRGRESSGDIEERLARATFTMPIGITYETIVNDRSLTEGTEKLLALIQPVRA